jgi:thioredoxin-related protein
MKIVWILFAMASFLFAVSFGDALKEAKEHHKMILVELIMESCPYCLQMDKYVLSKADVQAKINEKFIFVKLDIDKDEIPDLLTSRMTPTFYFLNETGETVLQEIKGAPSKSEFLTVLSASYE